MKFEYLDHTADVKFRAYGKNLNEAFGNAGLALFNVMVDTKKVKKITHRDITVKGDDLKSLLFDFFNELIFLLDTENFFLAEIEEISVEEDGSRMTATLVGDDAAKYETHGPGVKAPTYSEMEIICEKDKVIVQAVVDI